MGKAISIKSGIVQKQADYRRKKKNPQMETGGRES